MWELVLVSKRKLGKQKLCFDEMKNLMGEEWGGKGGMGGFYGCVFRTEKGRGA